MYTSAKSTYCFMFTPKSQIVSTPSYLSMYLHLNQKYVSCIYIFINLCWLVAYSFICLYIHLSIFPNIYLSVSLCYKYISSLSINLSILYFPFIYISLYVCILYIWYIIIPTYIQYIHISPFFRTSPCSPLSSPASGTSPTFPCPTTAGAPPTYPAPAAFSPFAQDLESGNSTTINLCLELNNFISYIW